MNTYKYLVMPGHLRSMQDDQMHYVGAHQLMRLYNVNPKECLIYGDCRGRSEDFLSKLQTLVPMYGGDYSL